MPDSPGSGRPRPSPRSRVVAGLAIAAAGVIVYHGALAYFFAQDDWSGLARARGLLPRLNGPWRYLSGQTYFDLMTRTAGLEALPYHAVSLLAHIACALLLYRWLARRLSRPAALTGAVFFVAHPALFTAVYSVSGIGEITALLFALLALAAAEREDRGRWWAVPCFVLSLMAKESTVLLPLFIALPPASRAEDARAGVVPRVDPLAVSLLAVSLVYGATFLARDTFGLRQPLPEAAPYTVAFDATLWRNLLTYLGWTANFLILTVRRFADAVDPVVFANGVGLVVVWLVGFASKALRIRGWARLGALYFVLLVPVLPLRNHTYHYYLYAPLVAASPRGVAALVDAALVRAVGPRRRTPPARAGRARGRARAWPKAPPPRRASGRRADGSSHACWRRSSRSTARCW